MAWQYTPYIFPLIATGLLSIGLALFSWRRRPVAGTTFFTVLMLAVAEWCLVYALRLSSVQFPTQVLWAKLRYLGIATAPLAWLLFVLEYTGHEKWLKPHRVAILAAVPLLTLLLVWTNEWHRLYWARMWTEYEGSLAVLRSTYGPARWVHVTYTYGALLVSIVLLARTLPGLKAPFRGQALMLILCSLITGVGDALSTYKLIRFPLDTAPFAFALAGVLIIWNVYCLGLFNVVSLARNLLIHNIKGGVMVLDMRGRVLYANPVAERIFNQPLPHDGELRVERMSPAWATLARRYRDTLDAHDEIALEDGESKRYYDLHISPILDQRARPIGRLIVAYDITDHKRAELSLEAQKRLFESLVAIARATIRQTTLEATLRSALGMVVSLTGAERGSLFLLDEHGNILQSVLSRDVRSPQQQRELVKRVMESGLAGWAVRHRQPAIVTDTTQDQRWLHLPDSPYTARSALAAPIVSGAAVLGVLTLMHPQPNYFTPEHIYLINSSVDQLALAIRNAQMYEETRRLARHQATLYETLRTAGALLEPESIARAVVGAIARLTGWPAVAILLPDEFSTHLKVSAASGLLAEAEGRLVPSGQGAVWQAFNSSQPCHLRDLADGMACTDFERFSNLACELAVPVQHSERVLGVLLVASDQPFAFSDDDVNLTLSLADTIALALENARLYQATLAERGRLQALIESSQDGIVLIGVDQCILVINARAMALLHLPDSPTDWIGRPLTRVLELLEARAPEAARLIYADMKRVAAGEDVTGGHKCEIAPRTIYLMNLPVKAGDSTLGRLLVLRDITEERLLERMRDDLIHSMVHDLRNPLTAIYGALSFLDDTVGPTLSDTQRQLWSIAVANTNHMLRLVKAILEINRLESHQMPVEQGIVPLFPLVSDVLYSQSPIAHSKDIRLVNEVPPDLPPLWADERLLERVLQNLVSNAVKFTPAGGLVRVTARREETEPHRVVISVSDTGAGIPSEIRGRLFQKFVTGPQPERGSGLGLAFCRMAVEAHGERIWVEETPGSGTTISFTMPLPPSAA
ncbi:MAG: GAF domain-containing protein [Anaerolineae bacterium]|nr:GAF domain-containing protein [Anaerolineae bacterium]